MNRTRKAIASAAMIGATLGGGALGAVLLSGTANAQTDSTTSATTVPADSSATAPVAAPATPRDPSKGGHTANGITETVLTGDAATQVSAAALAAVPDATIDRVENDAEGATYEAHMTKSDGSKVTVKLNADFSIAGIETGMK